MIVAVQNVVEVDKRSMSHSLDVGCVLEVGGGMDEPLDYTEKNFLRGDSSRVSLDALRDSTYLN